MQGICAYLLSVAAAGIICAVCARLLPKDGTVGTLGKMIMGVFLAVTVIRPLTGQYLPITPEGWKQWSQESENAVSQGKEYSQKALQDIIKQRTEAYILGKAGQLKAELTVRVSLTEDEIPVPRSVELKGNVSPYAKKTLQTMLSQELGIPEENQIWR